jgi:biotin operon repressor
MGNKNKNKNENRKGIWIPEEIINDNNLDWTNKALLTEIYSLCKLEDGCFKSDSRFGTLLGIGRTSVNKRVNWLKTQGYINTKNHHQDKLCIGRTITKSSSVEKHTLVLEEDKGSSQKTQGVVLKEDNSSSVENTINSSTNSDLTIQETIQYTGATKNNGLSINQSLNNKFEELVFELVEKSSLGEEIFYYTEPENLDMFRDAVDEKEYKIVYPILANVIDMSRKLHGI